MPAPIRPHPTTPMRSGAGVDTGLEDSDMADILSDAQAGCHSVSHAQAGPHEIDEVVVVERVARRRRGVGQ